LWVATAETARRYHGAQLSGSSFLEAELGSASRMAERWRTVPTATTASTGDDEAQRPGITAPLWRSRTQNREREIGLGRRRQEERKLYFTTREIFQTRDSSTVVLVCFYPRDRYVYIWRKTLHLHVN
jgi:hypothetical protein